MVTAQKEKDPYYRLREQEGKDFGVLQKGGFLRVGGGGVQSGEVEKRYRQTDMIRILKLFTAGSLHANESTDSFLIGSSCTHKNRNGQLITVTWEIIQKPGQFMETKQQRQLTNPRTLSTTLMKKFWSETWWRHKNFMIMKI
jgi:hypothetical protein